MGKIGPAIAGSQAAPASTGTAQSKSPLISAITDMMDKKIKANPTRFTQNASAFKIGSGMPAYVIGTTVDAVVYDASAKEMVATTKGYVAEHPSRSMKVTNAVGRSKQPQMTKPPSDEDKVLLLVDAAGSWTDTASGCSVLTFRAAMSASSASTTIRSAFPFRLRPTVDCIGTRPLSPASPGLRETNCEWVYDDASPSYCGAPLSFGFQRIQRTIAISLPYGSTQFCSLGCA